MDHSSAIATLEGWLQDQTGVTRDVVRQLLIDIGYEQVTAADYRVVWLYYRAGWPRWSLMSTNPNVPVGYILDIANKMIPLLREVKQ